MVEWIEKDLGVTTLRYQRLSDMIDAIGLPEDSLCQYCWTGKEFQEECSYATSSLRGSS